jgi:uncharacterized protein YjbI with pentapeptide repeats
LQSIDLQGADLQGANLTGLNLTGINLENADLKDAILIRAAINEANLWQAYLQNADLCGASLERTKVGYLYGVNASRAFLHEIKLPGMNWVNLCKAALNTVDLSELHIAIQWTEFKQPYHQWYRSYKAPHRWNRISLICPQWLNGLKFGLRDVD